MNAQLLEYSVIILLGAILVDILFGEPRSSFHPVSLIRRAANGMDHDFRNIKNKQLGGLLLLVTILLIFLVPITLILYFSMAVKVLFVIIGIILLKETFSVSRLSEDIQQIVTPMESGNLEEARVFASRYSKTDLTGMTEGQICSIVIERISSQLINDVISPFFYFAILGVPAAFFSRISAVMDSLYGQRNKKNFEFGRWIAVVHSAVNYIPSRISTALVYVSSEFLNYRVTSVPLKRLRTIPESGNLGWPIGAFSSSLNLKLERPGVHIINESGFEPSAKDVRRAARIYYISFYTMIIFITIELMIIFLYLL